MFIFASECLMPDALMRVVLAGVLVATTHPALADIQAGRQKAQMCATCHGPMGLATMPNTPNLAGQPEIYLSNQLRAYRSGERRHEVMAVIAKPLSDDDIANLAAWFSSVRIEAKAPN